MGSTRSIAYRLSSNGCLPAHFWSSSRAQKISNPLSSQICLCRQSFRVLSSFSSLWPSGGEGRKKPQKKQPGSLKMYEINAGDRAQLQKKEEEGNKGQGKKKQRKLCLWKFCGVLFLVKLLFASWASDI